MAKNDADPLTGNGVTITVRDLYQLVYIQKLSDAQIAKLKGLPRKTIRSWRRQCQFDPNFKIGRMDLPLHEVRQLLADGWEDEDVVKHFNTTKTSFESFKKRHGLASSGTWPLPRRDLANLVAAQFDDNQIAKMQGVDSKAVAELLAQYGLKGFAGTKCYEKFGNDRAGENLGPLSEYGLEGHAQAVLGDRLSYCPRRGYLVDGRHVTPSQLVCLSGWVPVPRHKR